MIIFPAIDIKKGEVVRLVKGKFDQVTVYSDNPVDIAMQWERAGAQWLHVVDLDGAKTGVIENYDHIIKITQAVQIPVQMGGGIREKKDIKNLLLYGVKRVILGTKIIESRDFLKDVIKEWKDRIVVSLDCENGMVAQKGWTAASDLKAVDLVGELQQLGLSTLIYTDIARDGTLSGPNFSGIEELLEKAKIPIIASGGVSSLDDLKKLLTLVPKGLVGAITGKAIYEGRLDLKEAIDLCSPKE